MHGAPRTSPRARTGVLAVLACDLAAATSAARARLRRDVDAALAEHRRLADELAQLDPGGGGGGPS